MTFGRLFFSLWFLLKKLAELSGVDGYEKKQDERHNMDSKRP